MRQLGLDIIYAENKKPYNAASVRNHFPEMKPSQLCIVGDRLLTDILLAHKMGAMSILVDPVDVGSESIQIRIMRAIENIYLKIFYRQ